MAEEYITEELEAGKQKQLAAGMRLQLVRDMPYYEVVEAGAVLKLRLEGGLNAKQQAGLPAEMVFSNKTMIGRLPGEGGWVTYDPHTSRQHGSLHPSDGKWYYTQYGANKASIATPKAMYEQQLPVEPQLIDEGTILQTSPQQEMEPFQILNGMTIQFHHHFPPYKASIQKEGWLFNKTEVLKLTYEGKEDPRWPKTITVRQGEDIKLGRTSKVRLIHPEISGDHASIEWNKEMGGFQYVQLGRLNAVIRLPELMAQLEKDFSALSISKEDAAAQFFEAVSLLSEIRENKSALATVQDLEEASLPIGGYQNMRGAHTEDAQKGYDIWIRGYEFLHREKNPDAKEMLLRMAGAIRQMGEDRAVLRDIEAWPLANFNRGDAVMADPESLKGPERKLTRPTPGEKASRHRDVAEYVFKKADALEEAGEIYLVSGFKQHHTVTKIKKDPKGGYLVTNYNAGADARPGKKRGYVLGMYEQRLNPEVPVEDFIWMLAERKLHPLMNMMGLALGNKLEAALGPIRRSHEVTEQHKGNCTTRSTREALRDALPANLFADLHRNVSDPNRIAAVDLEKAVEMKLVALRKILGYNGPSEGPGPAQPEGPLPSGPDSSQSPLSVVRDIAGPELGRASQPPTSNPGKPSR